LTIAGVVLDIMVSPLHALRSVVMVYGSMASNAMTETALMKMAVRRPVQSSWAGIVDVRLKMILTNAPQHAVSVSVC